MALPKGYTKEQAEEALKAHSEMDPGEFILFREGKVRFVALAEGGHITRRE